MEVSDKKVRQLKAILEKDHGREFTWDEAHQAMRDIMTIVELSLKTAQKEFDLQKKLKKSPKGFHLDERVTCLICGSICEGGNTWFDKYGLKCAICQQAINSKIIPGSIALKKDSWYSKFELEMYFNIGKADLNRFIKTRVLQPRIILGKSKKPHFYLFLLKDNKEVLPPKSLLRSRTVKTLHNGEEYYTQECWYEFADERLIRRLSKYEIIHYLKETLSKPIQTGRFLFKSVNPLFSFQNE